MTSREELIERHRSRAIAAWATSVSRRDPRKWAEVVAEYRKATEAGR